MKAIFNRLKKVTFGLAALALLATIMLSPAMISTSASSPDFDAAALYKTKCAMCHGPKAEKKFDATLPDADLTAAIMSGKKGEKPPNMPEFESKGVTADQATALVVYMKSLKQ
jgi:cytochrome c553